MNDLVVEPGQTAVLQEAGQFSSEKPFSGGKIGFSFDWMLTVPVWVASTSTPTAVTDPTRYMTVNVPTTSITQNQNGTCVTWAEMAFCWHTYTRRKVQAKVVNVKCFTPGKMMMEWIPNGYLKIATKNQTDTSIECDLYGYRNCRKEFDITNTRVHTFDLEGLYVTASKFSSRYRYAGTKNDSKDLWAIDFDEGDMDGFEGGMNLIIPQTYQRGMLYPDTFTTAVFLSYAGSLLQTITHPSAIEQFFSYEKYSTYLVERLVMGRFNTEYTFA